MIIYFLCTVKNNICNFLENEFFLSYKVLKKYVFPLWLSVLVAELLRESFLPTSSMHGDLDDMYGNQEILREYHICVVPHGMFRS